MGIADITSSRAKLVRANEHFKALEEEVHEFGRDEDAKSGTITYQRDGVWHVIYLSPIPLLPMYIALLAGDCLNNVRAALDHLVWQLVLREDKEPKQTNSFPIYDTENEFRNKCITPAQNFKKQHPLRGIPLKGDAWKIIEQAQPFHHPKPEEHPLAVVSWLNNIDKHRVLLVQKTFTARDLFSSRIHWKPGFQPIDQRFSTLPLSSEQPTEIARFLFAPGIEPDLHSAMNMEELPLQPCVGDGEAHVNILRLDLAIRRVNQILDEVTTLPRVKETPLQSKVAKRGAV